MNISLLFLYKYIVIFCFALITNIIFNTDTGIYGIVADDVAQGEDAVIYLTGEFFEDALELESGVTAAGLEIKLRDIGIFLKDGGSNF